MNTHIHTLWNRAKQPIAVALGAVIVGAVLGVVFPPDEPLRYCPTAFKAHFLERQIAFNLDQRSSSSSSSERLRAAAPVEEASSSSKASLVVAPAIDVAESIVENDPSESLLAEPSWIASSDTPSSEASSESSFPEPSSSEQSSSVSSASGESPSSSSASSEAAAIADATFPAFDRTVFPVARTPNWGAMKTPAEWNRSYDEMDRSEFVRVPAYDLGTLTTPMETLLEDRDAPETIEALTAKLFYSTRYFGSYDLDEGEFTGDHAGIDLKVPEGTPVGAIAGGRVASVLRESKGLGTHVIVEHRLGDETFYSIYGHLRSAGVREGQDVAPGEYLGSSGSTGRSTGPHLHVQVDRGLPGETDHEAYQTDGVPNRAEAARNTVNPMSFIAAHAR